jgi:formylglycine-generating enzyme required for sulfatase activity
MQALVSALLVIVIIGLVGWINQAYLKDKWRWYTITRPYMFAQVRPYVLTPEAEKALRPGGTFRECSKDCPEMMVIPVGSFTMGSPLDEKNRTRWEGPQHVVTISVPFAVSRYLLTFADWDACAAFGNCDPDISDSGFGHGRQPVINVTWSDASRYVAWLSQMTGKPYRLLTEAEHEYAARAGTTTVFPGVMNSATIMRTATAAVAPGTRNNQLRSAHSLQIDSVFMTW